MNGVADCYGYSDNVEVNLCLLYWIVPIWEALVFNWPSLKWWGSSIDALLASSVRKSLAAVEITNLLKYESEWTFVDGLRIHLDISKVKV